MLLSDFGMYDVVPYFTVHAPPGAASSGSRIWPGVAGPDSNASGPLSSIETTARPLRARERIQATEQEEVSHQPVDLGSEPLDFPQMEVNAG